MRRGIGFLAAYKFDRIITMCHKKELSSSADYSWVKIQLRGSKKRCIYVCNVYLPTHGMKEPAIMKKFATLTRMISYIRAHYPGAGIILAGDFNAHTDDLITEHGSSYPSNLCGQIFAEWISELGIKCHNALTPLMNITRVNVINNMVTAKTMIDYVLSSGCRGEEAFAIDGTGISDHNLVVCDFDLNTQEFMPDDRKPYTRVNLDILTRRSDEGAELRKQYATAVSKKNVSMEVQRLLNETGLGRFSVVDRATAAAKFRDRTVMTICRRICGVTKIHPRYTKPGYTLQIAKLRHKRSLLPLTATRQRNALSHKVSRLLSTARSKYI